MSFDIAGEGLPSVAPPGWAPTAAPAPPLQPAADPRDRAADAAVRWRIGAAVLDNILVYGGYLLVCIACGWPVWALSNVWLLLVAGVAYHFLFEARDGQTPGKRRYGIRVVSVDGGPAGARAVALRSLLRLIDQLPICYVSGLVSMVRTGPQRRQRIGDVAGGTKVIAVDGHAARSGTPGWLLPAATLFAVLASVTVIYAATRAGNTPLTGAQRAEFIIGCERSPAGRVVNCGCMLNQLQADGYDTFNQLRDLGASEQAGGPTALQAHQVVSDAARNCRS